jgi:hypothetical protein
VRSNGKNADPNSLLLDVIPTTAEILAGGAMIEFVRVDGDSKLLVWRDGQSHVSARFQCGTKTYEPMRLDPTILEGVRFPGVASDYGSTGELFQKILAALSKLSGLPSRELQTVPYWILSSWFPEILPTLPILVVTGPSRAEAQRFLRLLHCFVRRGVLVTELTPPRFLGLPMHLSPTILIDQSKFPAQMRGLLRAASSRGTYIPRAGRLVAIHCVRAVFCEKDDLDLELDETALRVSLFQAGPGGGVLDARAADAVAAEFQPKLLQYRFTNFRTVSESGFDVPTMTPGMRELAHTLSASVVGDPKLTNNVQSMLSSQDDDMRASWTTDPVHALIVTMLALVHERELPKISVKKLTEFVNTTLRESGDIREFSPVEIGRLLSRLSFSRSRHASGMIIELSRPVSIRVHDLRRRYDIKTSPASFPGCHDCEPAQAARDSQDV